MASTSAGLLGGHYFAIVRAVYGNGVGVRHMRLGESHPACPTSGYYRLFIWEYGSAAVLSNPIFGIDLGTWQKASFMSFSIDNFWLLMAMQSGLPMAGALVLGVGLLLASVHRFHAGSRLPGQQSARFAWTTALVVLSMQGATVHYWGQLYMFFFYLVGLGAWMADRQMYAPTLGTSHGDQRLAVMRGLVTRPPRRLVQRQ
jgi:hypothetical protein